MGFQVSADMGIIGGNINNFLGREVEVSGELAIEPLANCTIYVNQPGHYIRVLDGSQPPPPANHPPSITLDFPRGGEVLSRTSRVAYHGQDLDQDIIDVLTEISSDGGITWTRLFFVHHATFPSFSEPGISWDTTPWPDGDRYRIRVTANDGKGGTATDISGIFSIRNGGEASASLLKLRIWVNQNLKPGDTMEIHATLSSAKAPIICITEAPVEFYVDDQYITTKTTSVVNTCLTQNITLKYTVPSTMRSGSHTLKAAFNGGFYGTTNWLPSQDSKTFNVIVGEGKATVLSVNIAIGQNTKPGDTMKIEAKLAVAGAPLLCVTEAPVEFYVDDQHIGTKATSVVDTCLSPNVTLNYLVPSNMAAGLHTLKAVFRGGFYDIKNWLPSEDSKTFTVVTGTGEATILKLRLLPDTGMPGDLIRIQASVCVANKPVFGLRGVLIEFFIEGQSVGTKRTTGAFCDLFGALQTELQYTIPASMRAGSYEVKAVFQGATDASGTWLSSQATTVLTVVGGSAEVILIERAVDSNQNSLIDDTEMIQALGLWIKGQTVPGTGTIIDDITILRLLSVWVRGESIGEVRSSHQTYKPDRERITSRVVSFAWPEFPEAVSYQINIRADVNIGEDGGFLWAEVSENSYLFDFGFVHRSYIGRTFYWGVRPRYGGGTWGQWSPTMSFIYAPPMSELPPLEPEIPLSPGDYVTSDGVLTNLVDVVTGSQGQATARLRVPEWQFYMEKKPIVVGAWYHVDGGGNPFDQKPIYFQKPR
jgi:hypothetical protein